LIHAILWQVPTAAEMDEVENVIRVLEEDVGELNNR